MKSTIDFECNYTVFEAVETIYKLHNHALNYGNKYTLEITISEDKQEILMDEIPIGTTEKLNIFSFLENHINHVYEDEEDSEEHDLLLKLIKTMLQEYQAEQMTSNIYQSIDEQEEEQFFDDKKIDIDKEHNEPLEEQENNDIEPVTEKQSYYYKGIKAIVLGVVIMVIVYGGYQIVTNHA